jgi:hypothetical protein
MSDDDQVFQERFDRPLNGPIQDTWKCETFLRVAARIRRPPRNRRSKHSPHKTRELHHPAVEVGAVGRCSDRRAD